jgi:hypothetical protein
MAVVTPRGVKVRLPTDYAFALIGRLHPRVTAYRVLETTDVLHRVPNLLLYVCALVCLAAGASSPPQILLPLVLAHLVGTFLTLLGLWMAPLLMMAAVVFTYLSGYGALFLIIAGLAYLRGGMEAIAGYVAGIVLSIPARLLVERLYRRAGHSDRDMGRAETNFLNAYKFHAALLGEDTSTSVLDVECDEQNWHDSFVDLASSHPEVTARFTPD